MRRELHGFAVALQVAAQLVVVALGMREVDAGDVDRERAVDEDRHVRQPALRAELIEREHDLLRAPDGERGNDHLAAARRGAADHLRQPVERALGRIVHRAAVGRLADQPVAVRHLRRIAHDRPVRVADVAGEAEPDVAPALARFEHHGGRAQDVAGVAVLDGHVARRRERLAVRDAGEELERALGVGLAVERLGRRLALRAPPLVDELERRAPGSTRCRGA